MSRLCPKFLRLVGFAGVFSLAFRVHAHAQASRTATKSADISVFAGVQAANPDSGPDNVAGGVFGADVTSYSRLPIEPSLEFRANFISGTYVAEHSYLVGVRAAARFRTFKPYIDFLIGPGFIQFPRNIDYTHDDSKVYSFGGGIDVAMTRNFALKLDGQTQRWNTGEFRYTPALVTLGVKYTIPFRPHINQEDLGR